jgi:hypothetical protein
MTLGVVEIAPHMSPSNKLDINRSNGSNLLGKTRSSSQTTIKGHGKKSIHIKHERGYSLRMLTEKIYIPNFVTRSLQIDWEEKDRLGARRTAIPVRFLMSRTCTGSERSKNLGRLGPRGIIVDTTPVL